MIDVADDIELEYPETTAEELHCIALALSQRLHRRKPEAKRQVAAIRVSARKARQAGLMEIASMLDDRATEAQNDVQRLLAAHLLVDALVVATHVGLIDPHKSVDDTLRSLVNL